MAAPTVVCWRRNQVAALAASALGPELLPWAREYTNDLNEAHFLVHQVVSQLAVRFDTVRVHEARTLMTVVAQQNGIAGRTLETTLD